MEYSENVNVRRNWEVCTRGAAATRWASMYASMKKYGDIVINRVAHERLGKPDACQLLYDRERETIGLKPSRAARDNEAFPIRDRGRAGGLRIRANRLLREFGITLLETRVFNRCQLDNRGVLILDLRFSQPLARRIKRPTSLQSY